jgi:hypothetical protein
LSAQCRDGTIALVNLGAIPGAATDIGGLAVVGAAVRGQVLQPTLQAPLGDIGPFRIDRPPNLLASL